MSDITLGLVLAWFDKISAVPRTSGDEAAISDLVAATAQARGYEVHRDESHNLLVRKPAAPGQGERPGLALQTHLDMVGEADPGSSHDFAVDPIRVVRDGDLLRAEGTTLGADDGIGLALALCILESDDVAHPALEFLFTTREETGLEGAKALDFGPLQSRYLLNIDGEQDGVFLTSCAGGTTIDLTVPLGPTEPVDGCYRVHLRGLRGGHSGLDIDKGRHNGIVATNALLARLAEQHTVRLASIDAPGKFNAINRDAAVVVWTDADTEDAVAAWFGAIAADEPDAEVTIERISDRVEVASPDASQRIIALIEGLPQGVNSYSEALGGLVESSLNVGLVETTDGRVLVTASVRSSDTARHTELLTNVEILAESAGAELRLYGQYPAWEFDPDNPLLHQAERIFADLFGTAPRVAGVHGGLECAVLADKYPGVAMLSVGAELLDCHTPRERANVPSIDRLRQLVIAIVESVGAAG